MASDAKNELMFAPSGTQRISVSGASESTSQRRMPATRAPARRD
ncbi:hypothetical protein [Burkholderia vietnamiensis]|nr:hypothetical protein [Burkholderia vietnamiensis]MDN8035908.1 hypothetical protein [Burkholderia vietnamiensis]